jgi:hypothetical protein
MSQVNDRAVSAIDGDGTPVNGQFTQVPIEIALSKLVV